jgi:hypothetical protein
MKRRAVPIAATAGLLFLALAAVATAADPPGEKTDDPGKRDEEHRREAEKVVGAIEVEVPGEGGWVKVERIEKPLLYYGDPTRDNDRGSLWGWGRKGRPVALVELYQNVTDRTKWVYAICNTSGGRLRAARDGNPWWAENESAAELKDVPGAPAPAADAPRRQSQMKMLAQKFTGHQFWDPDNSRYELRRLERPLHTYRDEANGVLDGGLYTLANGTNPEIMLFLEARVGPQEGAKPVWQYAVGRLAHAELHLLYDGKEVFTAPRGDRLSGRNKPYWVGFITTAPAGRPDR